MQRTDRVGPITGSHVFSPTWAGEQPYLFVGVLPVGSWIDQYRALVPMTWRYPTACIIYFCSHIDRWVVELRWTPKSMDRHLTIGRWFEESLRQICGECAFTIYREEPHGLPA